MLSVLGKGHATAEEPLYLGAPQPVLPPPHTHSSAGSKCVRGPWWTIAGLNIVGRHSPAADRNVQRVQRWREEHASLNMHVHGMNPYC